MRISTPSFTLYVCYPVSHALSDDKANSFRLSNLLPRKLREASSVNSEAAEGDEAAAFGSEPELTDGEDSGSDEDVHAGTEVQQEDDAEDDWDDALNVVIKAESGAFQSTFLLSPYHSLAYTPLCTYELIGIPSLATFYLFQFQKITAFTLHSLFYYPLSLA